MTQFTFYVLDPRKAKRAQIAASLQGQNIAWRRVPGLAPITPQDIEAQAKTRARAALDAQQSDIRARWKTAIKLWLLTAQYVWVRRFFAAKIARGEAPVAVAWNGLNGSRRVWIDGARDAGAKVLCYEHAPFPEAITADPRGVNFENGLPRRAAPYLDWLRAHPQASGSWRAAAQQITQRAPRKAPEPLDPTLPPLTAPFIFVALQSQGDSQLRLFGGACRSVPETVDHLIAALQTLPRDSLPEGWHIRLKEHPTTPFSVRAHLEARRGDLPIVIDNATDTFQQARAARAVCTVNSSVGIEAMMLGQSVIVMGQAYWALPEITNDGSTVETLRAALLAPKPADTEARDAFLSYLAAAYYPRITKTDLGFAMPASDRAKLIARLTNGPFSGDGTP